MGEPHLGIAPRGRGRGRGRGGTPRGRGRGRGARGRGAAAVEQTPTGRDRGRVPPPLNMSVEQQELSSLEGRFATMEEQELARLEGRFDPPESEEQLRRLEGLPEEGPLGGMAVTVPAQPPPRQGRAESNSSSARKRPATQASIGSSTARQHDRRR